MVNDKGKGTVLSSNLSPKHDDAADNSQSETTVSSPMKLNVKETGVVSESEDKEENTSKGVMNEENAMVVMKNGEIAIEEELNEETAMEEEEKHEENAMEEDEKNEPNALEEEEDYEEENATEEEGEKEEEKEEENEEKTIEPTKTEEKIGADSKDKEKRSKKRGRNKQVAQRGSEKVVAKLEDTWIIEPEKGVKKG
ncbi:X-linked retinitis pigmentosa GTPase regulator-interacting protein 1-like [Camellia sinensis]|uniref:X-linked retinitis pigmentosa GTPase regulator-interacting protein 1-like n=1 Tax=Camellia sinensis TaxID=4442 RepID=UPI001036614E|nr:X-linked retinitis pigmentosa GTPase regulator-interacting protein 1-like [Camellia sinensis]XP_028073733.1 X-linked retinitis pigmentosa GTPase regulator-interacting protein 1-like [Camellia sinensis]